MIKTTTKQPVEQQARKVTAALVQRLKRSVSQLVLAPTSQKSSGELELEKRNRRSLPPAAIVRSPQRTAGGKKMRGPPTPKDVD